MTVGRRRKEPDTAISPCPETLVPDTLSAADHDACTPEFGHHQWMWWSGCGALASDGNDNEIDETVLPSLTAEDLKDLGVSIVGHRRKLLDAIAALRTDAGAKAPSPDAATTSSAPTISLEDRAERRQITVMFSDLVGSTALSARMDPEDLRELISAYHKCVAETVRRFGGFVAQYLGDGVLVPAGSGAEIGVGPPHRGRSAVPTGHAPACNLPVQACPGAGRGVRDATARAATHTTCPHRRNHRERIRGKR